MYLSPPPSPPPMTCPYCDSVLAQYGRDYKKCNKCHTKLAARRGTVPDVRPIPSPQLEVVTENTATPQPHALTQTKVNPRKRRKRYYSTLKRLIEAALLREPSLTNLELSRQLDADEHIPPETMQTSERSFESRLQGSQHQTSLAEYDRQGPPRFPWSATWLHVQSVAQA